ncbi:MAG: TrkA C-terminal domain-containing protein, partial [Calditrichia bacterium]
LLAGYFQRESIYTMKLVRKGINIFEGRDVNILRKLEVKSVMKTDIECIPADMGFLDLIRHFIHSRHEVLMVVNKRKELTGIITMGTLKEFIMEQENLSGIVIAADITEPAGAVFYPEDNLDLVMHQFGRYDLDELPVLKKKNSHELAGSITLKDVIDAYNREIFKLDLAGGVHSVLGAVSGERNIEISRGYRLMEVEPPSSFIDKSISELNIRQKFGLEIILIRNNDDSTSGIPGRPGTIPAGNYVIQKGDKLLVMGSKEDIENFQRNIHKREKGKK